MNENMSSQDKYKEVKKAKINLNYNTNEKKTIIQEKLGKDALLYINVNLGPQWQDRIVVTKGDTPENLAQSFSNKHSKLLLS